MAQSAVASEADVDAALDLARRSEWRHTSATHRADVLIRAAAWLRVRRLEIAALEVRETAKPWREADADVCEAIDFLEYYARAAIALSRAPGGAARVTERRADPAAGRAQRAALVAARRRGGHLAVELPGRDPARDGLGRPGHRQRRRAQARRAGARLRVHARARAARVGRAAVGARAAARRGPGRRAARRRPARAHDRVHRLGPGRAGDRPPRRRAGARAEAPQARRGRDGRQELRDRRLRRRPRRRRPGAGQVRVQLRGPEVLGRRPRAGPRGDPRRPGRAAGGRDRGAPRRPGLRPRDRRPDR